MSTQGTFGDTYLKFNKIRKYTREKVFFKHNSNTQLFFSIARNILLYLTRQQTYSTKKQNIINVVKNQERMIHKLLFAAPVPPRRSDGAQRTTHTILDSNCSLYLYIYIYIYIYIIYLSLFRLLIFIFFVQFVFLFLSLSLLFALCLFCLISLSLFFIYISLWVATYPSPYKTSHILYS